ncbi:ATP-dependent DNA helicase RecG [Deltaproteobacteria bacterium]|nr:ATP-dependent DNA helicase RecG [Deltaproteobacteria bacterium]
MISDKNSFLKQIQNLSSPLTSIKGVGPKRAVLLARKGLNTILDLFYFMPIRYEDRTRISLINSAIEESPVLVKGMVVYGKEERFYPSRKRLYKILIKDDTGSLELLWFRYNKPHLNNFVRPGAKLTAYGNIKSGRGKKQMFHPDITITDTNDSGDTFGIFPVYSSVEGISDNILRKVVRASLDTYMDDIIDPIPDDILNRTHLPRLSQSIERVHFPPKESSMERLKGADTPAHKRLIFDRFFYVMLAMTYRKKLRGRVSKPVSSVPPDLMKEMKKFFGFTLTSEQIRAVKEIINDLTRGRPMNRLLMGDVGTGKTVVAAAAAYISVQNSQQVALMVPTRVLADQHMTYFSSLPPEMGFRPVILTGNLKKGEREEIYGGIKAGRYNLIIGTHSLIQEGLIFSDLGLAIIDEQHRFGVKQRVSMDRKGDNPHLLVMSATPIPRTLAIIIYGDMDISVIRDYPSGHVPVTTNIVEEAQKGRVLETLKQRMSNGQQAFVICPVIEGCEDQDLKSAKEMEKRLSKILSPPFRVGIIHGQLSPDKRDKIMCDFHEGMIDLLVATTVIEVGVHVPNATVMVIEHPERFGLAQLHQLRGRVGRGIHGGVCFLMLSGDPRSRTSSRLEILAGSHDGFEIARKDLEIRGYGELTGMKQSGAGELDLSEVITHRDLLIDAKEEAQGIIESDPELLNQDHHHLKIMIETISGIPLDI